MMKCKTVIDNTLEEEVIIHSHAENELTKRIEEAVLKEINELEKPILGYTGRHIFQISKERTYCFSIEGGKLFAITDDGKFEIKERLYEISERLGRDFVKINQSCIANIKKIKKFDASISGTLVVIFKNGHRDYVSRRQLKSVKERMGF